MKKLFVNRGLPGSGKSTRTWRLAAEYAKDGIEAVVCSSDAYFLCPKCAHYGFDREKLPAAHAWCQQKAARVMEQSSPVVIVDNTNVTTAECRPYCEFARTFGYEVVFLEPVTPWAFDLDELERKNLHGVPREGLERMLSRWVPNMTLEKVLSGQPTLDERSATSAFHARKGKATLVAASGYFNPLHKGHIRYLEAARALGDFLVVIVNNDAQVVGKGTQPFQSESERLEIVRALGCVDFALLSIDPDRSVRQTLQMLRPHVFANGGDVTFENIREIEVCQDYGIQMVFGVGGEEKVQSSSWLLDPLGVRAA